MTRSAYVARAGVIAAVYAALTLLAIVFLQGLAFGPVQLRISELVCVLAVFSSAAVPGLGIGCFIANLLAIPLTGCGVMGLFDVVFGTLATVLGALWTRHFRKNIKLALAGPVLANALIVPAYLPLLLQAYGFYTIPFTDISIAGAYLPMYAFGVVSIGLGEALVMYVLGLPLVSALRRFGVLATDSRQSRLDSDKVLNDKK